MLHVSEEHMPGPKIYFSQDMYLLSRKYRKVEIVSPVNSKKKGV